MTLHRDLSGKQLRKAIVNKGLQGAAEFTWKRATEQTLKMYRELEENIRTNRQLNKLRENKTTKEVTLCPFMNMNVAIAQSALKSSGLLMMNQR